MFIGHFGAGFAVKKITSRPSLGTLFLAAQFLDLIWPVLLLFGIEHVEIDPGNTLVTPLNFVYYPISHSLFAAAFWSVLFGLVYYLIKKDIKPSVWLGILVMSHWIFDFITHRPDLPLMPCSPKFFGLGLWNSLAGTILVEGAIFSAGVFLYLKATKARNRAGSYGLWGLIVFLIIIYAGNLFGPPPPSTGPIAYIGLTQWLLVWWGYWIDRNREAI